MTGQLPLEDILLPAAPGWWPLAPGWQLLIAFSLLLLLVLAWLGWRAWQRRHWKRLSLRQLDRLDSTQPDYHDQLNSLLKRAASCYWPEKQVLGLFGRRWHQFLLTQLPASKHHKIAPLAELTSELRYAPQSPREETEAELHNAARFWLQQALPPARRKDRGFANA